MGHKDINVNQNIDINQREHVGIYKVINLDIFWLMRILTSLMMFWFSQLNPVKRITIYVLSWSTGRAGWYMQLI
jgi:hypothetical protein